MNTNDGGPAFPSSQEESVFDEDHGRYIDHLGPPQGGMSLRDYFAGQALSALLPNIKIKDWDDEDATIVAHVGGLAYELADAMLKARAE